MEPQSLGRGQPRRSWECRRWDGEIKTQAQEPSTTGVTRSTGRPKLPVGCGRRRPCGLAVVVAEQPTEPALSLDRLGVDHRSLRLWVLEDARRPIAQPLVWPEFSVMVRVGLGDVVQHRQAEAEEVVQALPLQAPDPRLGEAVGHRCPVRRKHRAAVFPGEMFVECLGELRVVVVDQEPHVDAALFSWDVILPKATTSAVATRSGYG
jgi:hypothetical protein